MSEKPHLTRKQADALYAEERDQCVLRFAHYYKYGITVTCETERIEVGGYIVPEASYRFDLMKLRADIDSGERDGEG